MRYGEARRSPPVKVSSSTSTLNGVVRHVGKTRKGELRKSPVPPGEELEVLSRSISGRANPGELGAGSDMCEHDVAAVQSRWKTCEIGLTIAVISVEDDDLPFRAEGGTRNIRWDCLLCRLDVGTS